MSPAWRRTSALGRGRRYAWVGSEGGRGEAVWVSERMTRRVRTVWVDMMEAFEDVSKEGDLKGSRLGMLYVQYIHGAESRPA